MTERGRGDRPKKTWRELDAGRDRAGPRPPRDERPGAGAMDTRAAKQYRAALDALFERGEVGKIAEKLAGSAGGSFNAVDVVHGRHREPEPPAVAMPSATPVEREPLAPRAAPASPPPPKEDGRAALRKKVIEALGREEISRAVDRYVKLHGWPNDFEMLEQALEHQKAERQAEAMAQLEKTLAKERPKRSRSLVGKLRLIEETADESELRVQAARIRGLL